jgi:hypothetical protein
LRSKNRASASSSPIIGGPAVSSGDRGVEIAMRVVEPCRALVIEVGQGALFENRGRFRTDRDNTVGKFRYYFRHALDQIGRVEPRLP